MKRLDNYLAGLWHELFDRDIERLLAGQEPHSSDLVALMSFVAELRSIGQSAIPQQFITDHVAVATFTVSASNAPTPLGRVRNVTRIIRRRLTATVAGFAMLGGLTGVAVASDTAIPGDWDYRIDRALESMGIGAGGTEERLLELVEMNRLGRSPAEVLEQTSALLDHEQGPASVALDNAANRVALNGAGTENSEEVHEGVGELLKYLSENSGNVDGQSVAEMAKQIGNQGNGNQGNGNQGNGNQGNGKKSP